MVAVNRLSIAEEAAEAAGECAKEQLKSIQLHTFQLALEAAFIEGALWGQAKATERVEAQLQSLLAKAGA